MGEGSLAHLPLRCETSLEISRFDYANLYTQWLNFLIKRFTIPFNRKLGCTVESLKGNGKNSCDGTDIYDSSVSGFAHERQYCCTHTDSTCEIRIHLTLYLFLGSEFDSSADTHPGIVDKYINAALLFQNCRYGIGY